MIATSSRAMIQGEIERLRRLRPQTLTFPESMEEQFERDTAKNRSYRLWLEGLIAILFLNGCLLLDYILVKNARWESIVLGTSIVTPLALLVNLLMRRNPRREVREGSVAIGTTLICLICLSIVKNATPAATTCGLLCVLITVLFVDVVMRIRLPYAAAATVAMSVSGFWFLAGGAGFETSERVVAASLLAVGIAITMTASYSLEREERLGYLLYLCSAMQGEELAARNWELQQMSSMDMLTGLPNRRAFEERFQAMWEEGARSGRPLSVLILDVDGFKALNDRYGHLCGDQMLQHIAGLLLKGLEDQTHFTARYGGEEFVGLLPDTELERALETAERIRGLVECSGRLKTETSFSEAELWATISCGVATCVPGAGRFRHSLLKEADEALYDAKAAGRNRVRHGAKTIAGVAV
ncbi:MAG: GGDEF domain-containing protein [Acidobacteriaceae bacterium]